LPGKWRLRQRINLAIMRTIRTQGLDFAFPTQTLHLPEGVAEKIVSRPAAPDAAK